jgi:hypothetical protein
VTPQIWPTCCEWVAYPRRGSPRRRRGSCASWCATGPSWSRCGLGSRPVRTRCSPSAASVCRCLICSASGTCPRLANKWLAASGRRYDGEASSRARRSTADSSARRVAALPSRPTRQWTAVAELTARHDMRRTRFRCNRGGLSTRALLEDLIEWPHLAAIRSLHLAMGSTPDAKRSNGDRTYTRTQTPGPQRAT